MRLLLATLVFIGIAIPINAAKLKCGRTPIRPNVVVTPKPKTPGKFEHRIAGGILSVPNSWPWQVLLHWHNENGLSFCSGTIIAKQWILTAAHCYSKIKPDKVKAYIGLHRVMERGKPLNIQKIYVHPKYRPRGWLNDILLLKLKHPIKYNKHVQPVCLPAADDDAITPPNTAWTTGWGHIDADKTLSNDLLEVNVPIFDADTCVEKYIEHKTPMPYNGTLQVCAGRKGESSCKGDSGGPLVIQSSGGSWFQHGITSYGSSVCGRALPTVYTRISGYCDWIKSTTRGAAFCHKL